MFDLTAQVARHPIADEPYLRHLRTSDVFNEVQETRDRLEDIAMSADEALMIYRYRLEEFEKAKLAHEAAKAKAALMASMEDL